MSNSNIESPSPPLAANCEQESCAAVKESPQSQLSQMQQHHNAAQPGTAAVPGADGRHDGSAELLDERAAEIASASKPTTPPATTATAKKRKKAISSKPAAAKPPKKAKKASTTTKGGSTSKRGQAGSELGFLQGKGHRRIESSDALRCSNIYGWEVSPKIYLPGSGVWTH